MKRFTLLACLLAILLALTAYSADARGASWPHGRHRNHAAGQRKISKKSHSFHPKVKHPKKQKMHVQKRNHKS